MLSQAKEVNCFPEAGLQNSQVLQAGLPILTRDYDMVSVDNVALGTRNHDLIHWFLTAECNLQPKRHPYEIRD